MIIETLNRSNALAKEIKSQMSQKIFSVFIGKSKVEFSMWALNGKYQGRVNHIVICEGPDYEVVRASLINHVGTDSSHNSKMN